MGVVLLLALSEFYFRMKMCLISVSRICSFSKCGNYVCGFDFMIRSMVSQLLSLCYMQLFCEHDHAKKSFLQRVHDFIYMKSEHGI